jgi:hypothetical protein
MINSGHYELDHDIITNLANGYAPASVYGLENADLLEWSSKTGHGSIYSTAEDLQKFAAAAMDNKLLNAESWKQIFANHGNSVGFSWFVSDQLGHTSYRMNGRAPGFAASVSIFPKDQLSIIVLSNNYVSLPPEISKNIAAIVFNQPVERTNLTTARIDDLYAQGLAGTYQFDSTFYQPNFKLHVSYKDGLLNTDWGGLVPIDKGNNHFTDFILRTYWSDIRFNIGSDMKVNSMNFDKFTGRKIAEPASENGRSSPTSN